MSSVPPGSAAVQVERVSRRFGTTLALDQVSIDIMPGEFLTLLGPSGCGKTTLLNVIAGFVEPDSGEISLSGKRITHAPPYLREIGMVFQNYALFPHMTVAENIAFGLKMRGILGAEASSRVQQALEMVRLPGVADRRPRQLSGGQQQRIALARALVINPRLILLDEPFSAIDKNLRAEMQVELKQIQKQVGITTVFVTHDQSEALSLSDRIAVMSGGTIQQLARPSDLYRDRINSFVASFIGDVNRLPCSTVQSPASSGTFLWNGQAFSIRTERIRHRGGSPVLFVRPDALTLVRVGDPISNLGAVTVKGHVYQGTHVDVLVEAGGESIRVREPFEALTAWPVGARAGLHADFDQCLIFEA